MLNELPMSAMMVFWVICGSVFLVFLKLVLSPLFERNQNKTALIIAVAIIGWVTAHALLALNHFYTNSFELPPRGFLMLIPPVFAIFMVLFFCWKGDYIQKLSLSTMTHIHVFRFPLELFVFTALFSAGNIPEIMTFYGSNPDIFVGLTAPIIGYFYFSRKVVSRRILLIWHVVSLGLLMNISALAILSLPYPFQQFGFEQANIAVLNFPFVLLPSLLVTVAYFCHIMSIHKLLVFKNEPEKSVELSLQKE